jgi:hypothetical protein
MQGPDSHALAMRAAPRFDSAEQAAEIAENYWMALTRDISSWIMRPHALITLPSTNSAASLISAPQRQRGICNAFGSLSRHDARATSFGPYISQFLLERDAFSERKQSTAECEPVRHSPTT